MAAISFDRPRYNRESLRRSASSLLAVVRGCPSFEVARDRLRARVSQLYFDTLRGRTELPSSELIRVRDCSSAMGTILSERADARAGFSVTEALWDIARGHPRDDLQPGFYAEIIHMVEALEGKARFQFTGNRRMRTGVSGRQAAKARSRELDRLWSLAEARMQQYAVGLAEESIERRAERRAKILDAFGAGSEEWNDWAWQIRHVVDTLDGLQKLVHLTDEERQGIERATANRLPFGVTPYYASLMDDETDGVRDRTLRAQVIPPTGYVEQMVAHRTNLERSCDFMLESDTSPVDLVTRRYPAIVILKPFNTCPQICVYCQRNWEIDQVMAPGALAPQAKIEAAMSWIERHPSVREVLITGGDPFALSDSRLEKMLRRLASIPHVDMIRFGTRTPVTLPMRIDDRLADMLGSFREPGRRDVVVVTHVEHSYEVTPEMAQAVDRLRRAGLAVYNQHVFTFFTSRRFEAALLRMVLRRIGVEPYYTFAPKGKEETAAYRVPLARLLQEQKEEARLMPGTRRTDEAVYNVPGLGKNYLRARQHRDLLSILPDGSRVYEFHPWEKNVIEQDTYVGADVSILDYLERLAAIGEDPGEYESIWYYY